MLTSKLRQWIVTHDPTSEQRLAENEEQMEELVEAVGKLLKVRGGKYTQHLILPMWQMSSNRKVFIVPVS